MSVSKAVPAITPSWLRIKEAAIHCSCSAEYLARCARERQLDHVRKGRCVFFSIAVLDAWLQRDTVKAA